MNNSKFIYHTLLTSIKFVNYTDLLPEITIHLDPYTSVRKLDRIYKFTDSKTICFDTFRIQKIISREENHYLSNNYYKYKATICKLVIEAILDKYLIDKSKYQTKEEYKNICRIYSSKYLARNIGKARKIVGRLDIANESDIILDNKYNLYLNNIKTDLVQ